MRIVVVSDNHGDRQIIDKLVNKYEGKVDGIFHCGDSEFVADDPLISKLYIVAGNMDSATFADDLVKQIGTQTILLTHGHLQNVNSGLLTLQLFARSKQANVVLFGHTHQLGVVQTNGILFLNPGSITYPRGQYAAIGGTYAVLTSDDQMNHVQYYDRELQPIDKLQFTFTK
ncbi:phosphoesterase [Lentilactobacillus fungorum]|uniref:Phosphoesterase n=1 Tax=Lentilactobacillus fungorum TaxID=2201250 RepID=A0ABQ3VY82_9LACO|nr:metallophosphoesterase [Lentilactobacillus fungorum]GHP12639.1 phosphoesterase [Lentilactobacillus fungorum]